MTTTTTTPVRAPLTPLQFDALADEAHARWAIHWDACRTAKRGDWCQRCDDLDLDANRAESLARRAHEDTAASIADHAHARLLSEVR